MTAKTQIENDRLEKIKNNSEILFIYDARMCNPNGDPDDENRPRMDYHRSVNLVSDVRLKRYIRDYLGDYKKDETTIIFVSKSEGAVVNAKTSLATILGGLKGDKIEIDSNQVDKFLDKAIDVRMFGAIIPDVKFEKGKGNVTFTGPIQFNWGHSLNKVTGPMESNGITSHFQTGKTTEEGESEKGSGAMGKDYRVDYSLIAFHGIISAKRANLTHLTDNDIKLFDDAMILAIPLEATSRSKFEQHPLLYIRIQYNSSDFFFGDLRRYVKIIDEKDKEMPFDETAKLRSPDEYKLDLSKLCEKLDDCKDKISKIHFWKHADLRVHGWNNENGKLKLKNDAEIQIIQLPVQNLENRKSTKS